MNYDKIVKRKFNHQKRSADYDEIVRLGKKGLTSGQIAMKLGIKQWLAGYVYREYKKWEKLTCASEQ